MKGRNEDSDSEDDSGGLGRVMDAEPETSTCMVISGDGSRASTASTDVNVADLRRGSTGHK